MLYNCHMEYTFSLGWLIFGIVLFLGGIAITVYYKQIADNFGHGLGSYDKTKMWGIIIACVGLVFASNLHSFIFSLLVNVIFGGF